jgi:hypothetical protein
MGIRKLQPAPAEERIDAMTITEEIIEAGARAYDPDLWNTATEERRDVLRWRARACLTAALAIENTTREERI